MFAKVFLNSATIVSRKKNGYVERDGQNKNVSLERITLAIRTITRSCRISQSSMPKISNRKASEKNRTDIRKLCR